jgi:hypothetical protein
VNDDTVRIAMWSGPRNISTAMMRSFENRADTMVWDEPLYAHYLEKTGIDHPMAKEIIATYECDWRRVVDDLTGLAPRRCRVFYQKHMCHHMLEDIGLGWLGEVTNCFLIRDPARVLTSYRAKRESVTLDDLGYPQQLRLFEAVRGIVGKAPPVLDCDDVLADPRAMLEALCAGVGIGFDQSMLGWPPGRRDSDGLWAAHWYAAVEASTGFGPAPSEAAEVPAELLDIVVAARPIYEELRQYRLTGEIAE